MQFFAPGRPATKGSTRSFMAAGRMVTKGANPRTKAWQAVVAAFAVDAGVEPIEGGVELELRFYFHRPKSHYGTGRNAAVLKATAPPRPITRSRGDLDKLVRAVLDGLDGIAYSDDSQVTAINASKHYLPRTEREGLAARVVPEGVYPSPLSSQELDALA